MNSASNGDISKQMIDFSEELNRQVVNTALEQSKDQIRISEEEKEATITYPSKISCF